MDLAKEWEAIHSTKTWGIWPRNEFLEFMGRVNLKVIPEKFKILDCGCGIGASMWPCLRNGMDAYGIDISPTAIKNATAFLKHEGYEPKLEVGNLNKLSYENEFFDIVVDVCSLQCNPINELPDIIKEIHRVLKPHALFFSLFRSTSSWLEPNIPFTERISAKQVGILLGPYFEPISLEESKQTFGDTQCEIVHHVITVFKK